MKVKAATLSATLNMGLMLGVLVLAMHLSPGRAVLTVDLGCYDLRPNCAELASNGMCFVPEKITWMNVNCEKSCRTCENVVLNMTTRQSSTVGDGVSSLAVDGLLGSLCTLTEASRNPWWMVDLIWRRRIKTVKLSYIEGSTIEKLRIGSTDIGPDLRSPIPMSIRMCYFSDKRVAEGSTDAFQCLHGGSVGRYLVIILEDDNSTLNLCEVEAFMEEDLYTHNRLINGLRQLNTGLCLAHFLVMDGGFNTSGKVVEYRYQATRSGTAHFRVYRQAGPTQFELIGTNTIVNHEGPGLRTAEIPYNQQIFVEANDYLAITLVNANGIVSMETDKMRKRGVIGEEEQVPSDKRRP